jgi:serine/threonine-protein kinase
MGGDPFGLSGQIIDGQYRVEGPIGEGGFSVVYKGHHLGLDEPVAIKCLKLDVDLDPQTLETVVRRFHDESRLSYRLSQGNLDIVRCLAAGSTVTPAAGVTVPYMVLEWLDGMSLAEDLRGRRVRGLKGRPIDEVVALLEPAVKGIAYAHAQGVVHRDLKPANLFLAKTRDGSTRLRVLDFGVAKVIDDAIGFRPSAQTVYSTMMVSPAYAAPEQFDPTIGPVGPWTDVYTLGLIVLELMRDQRARKGEGLARSAMEACDPAAQPTCHSLGLKVRPLLEVALARAVAVDIATRPRDAEEFWLLLKKGTMRGSTYAAQRWEQARAPAGPGGPAPAGTVPAPNAPTVPQGPHAPNPAPVPVAMGGTLVMAPAVAAPPGGLSSYVVSPAASTVGGREAPLPAGPIPNAGASSESPLFLAPGPQRPWSPPPPARATPALGINGRLGYLLALAAALMVVLLAAGGFALYRYRTALQRSHEPSEKTSP